MIMQHTTACGLEPFDKSFGGFQVGHGGFSTFERTNEMRKEFFETEFYIDAQRAVLYTEGHKKYKADPTCIRNAKALYHVLENVDLHIYDHELLVGGIAAPKKAAPIYCEHSLNWILHEMENAPFEKRAHDVYLIDEKTKDDLRSIADYWKGRTVEEHIDAMLSFDEKKGSELGIGMYLLNLYHYGGVGHFVIDYPRLMALGYDGIKAEVQAKLDTVDVKLPGGIEKRNEYQAMMITLNGASLFIERYAKLAEEKAAAAEGKRKEELLRIAANCRQIAHGPARDTWEALQLWLLGTNLILIETNGHSISWGRMDVWLNPFYEADMKNHTFTKDFVQELIEVGYLKANEASKLRDAMTTEANAGRGFGGESLTLGGVDSEGKDITNDLTFMMLDASVHTRMMVPWVCVRMHKETPWELKVKVAECMRAGYGHPKVYNDEAAIPAILKKNIPLEVARGYDVVGCVELDIPGQEFGWHDAAYFNILRTFELALNDGRCFNCGPHCPRHAICGAVGKKVGLSTGSLETFRNIEEVKESFDQQLKYFIDQMVAGIEIMELAHKTWKTVPYASALMPDCVECGRDLIEGGNRYNFTGPQANGIGSVVDGLSAIEQLVFDEKKVTGKELLDAVKSNWEINPKLYQLVNSSKVHHYGNDDDYADRFAPFVFDTYCRHVENRPNARGGFYTPGVYGVSANVGFGLITGPSVDGRKAFEATSDNMGPVHTAAASHDISGPTAIAKSVTKVDHTRATNGTLLNWKFTPEVVSGETGRNNLISLIDTYFGRGGMHSQFNIISAETMREAQKNPAAYQDMLVRVAGYSAYFVELSKPLQEDLISRTELSFE